MELFCVYIYKSLYIQFKFIILYNLKSIVNLKS